MTREFEPGSFDPELVHWPAQIGREELMIETLLTVTRRTAEELVKTLLEQSNIAQDTPSEETMNLSLRVGVGPMRFVTMNFDLESVSYVVTLEQDRATVLPEDEYHRFLRRRARRDG